MHIQLETKSTHSIEAYSDDQVQIESTIYQQSLIISKETIISPWAVSSLEMISMETLQPFFTFSPKIILIGLKTLSALPLSLTQALGKQGIGLECMTIGAACRTYNVLLSEERDVTLGLVFPS